VIFTLLLLNGGDLEGIGSDRPIISFLLPSCPGLIHDIVVPRELT